MKKILKIQNKIEKLEKEKEEILKKKRTNIWIWTKNLKYIAIKKTLDDNVYSNKGSAYILSLNLNQMII